VSIDLRLGPANVRFTGRLEGDMGHGGGYVHQVRPDVEARRRAVVDLPWTWLRQVHGDNVVTVTFPGEGAGSRADALITDETGCALAVLTADCAPVALASSEGAIGVVHAGWKGALAGVLQRAVKELRTLGATHVKAMIGPCIRPSCYQFGTQDLEQLVERYGPRVAARTRDGASALDLPATVRAALAEQGVDDVDDVRVCTACSGDHFSWRAGREQQRQAAVVWR
jgi:YfiH family protein